MKYLLFLLLALAVATPAQAGYRDLRRELDHYQPPALFRETLTAPPSPAVTQPEPAGEQAFRAAATRLRERQSAGLRELQQVNEQDFFQPDPQHLARLRPAAQDSAVAAEVLTGEFTLADLEILTALRNPKIRAAEARTRGALESYSQVTDLDDILRQYSAFTEGVMPGVGPMKGESVAMTFPFPGVLALKGDIAGQEVAMAREKLEIARRQAVTKVRRLYWNLLYNNRAREISGRTLELLRRLEAVAKARYEAGETSFQDLVRVRINRQTLEEELTTLKEQGKTLETELLAILDLKPATAVGAPRPQTPIAKTEPLPELYELALSHRQEIRVLQARITKTGQMLEMAETMILPDFSLNLSLYEDAAVRQVGTGAPRETFATSTTASRGQGLPKNPFYGTNDAYLGRTRQELQAARAELEQLENAVRAEVREAWFGFDRARRERNLYAKSVVELSQTALDVATRGYESGKVGFADVIGSYTTWLNANLTLARKKTDLGIAGSELAKTVGTSQVTSER